ncbi:hypothetical protein MUN77_01725 [Leucobacter allii]|uniref:hypothetical protein n=1 Tax=Leucobacter allii TaxID=2932247 RepID=UPI001FD541FA|nr:hypothetical protein [Leucobacter allii]UOR02079.1 hypothetical protein MUN77_01725 [Leucobacter allii]
MSTIDRFWLGEENVLEADDLGLTVYIDHYRREMGDKWSCATYLGVIAGVTEVRGQAELDENERPAHIGDFTEYQVEIHLADGRVIIVKERDRASIGIVRERRHEEA